MQYRALVRFGQQTIWLSEDFGAKRSRQSTIRRVAENSVFRILFVQNGQFWQYKYRWIWESKSRKRRESEVQSTRNIRRWNDQVLRRYRSLTFVDSVSLSVDVWWKLKSYYCVWPHFFNSVIWSSVFFLSVIPSFYKSCYKITFGAIN